MRRLRVTHKFTALLGGGPLGGKDGIRVRIELCSAKGGRRLLYVKLPQTVWPGDTVQFTVPAQAEEFTALERAGEVVRPT